MQSITEGITVLIRPVNLIYATSIHLRYNFRQRLGNK